MDDLRQHTPLYYQLELDLLKKLENGEWQPGEQIPTEAEICASYGVSRTTTRQALANLVHAGLLVRGRGKGTFVRERKATSNLTQPKVTSDVALVLGTKPDAKVLRFEVRPTDPLLVQKLQIAPGCDVVAVERLLLSGRTPTHIHRVYLPRELAPHLQAADFEAYDVNLLYQKEGLAVHHRSSTIEARLAAAEEANLLQVPRPSAVLILNWVSFLADGRPFEYMGAVARADRVAFRVDSN